MRAAVTRAAHHVTVEDVAEAASTGSPHDAVVQVSAVGLCGTDLHMWAGERAGVGFPLRQGHEIGGTVCRLPVGYQGPLGIGSVVAIDPAIPCGSCRPCRRGSWPHCTQFRAIGVALPGGLAERVAAPVAQLHATPGLTGEEAALLEPLSVAAMAVARADLRGDELLLVSGAGPIGLAIVICAELRGLRVMVSDPVPARRALARELGAERVVDPTTDPVVEAVLDWTSGAAVDAALEASGSPRALQDCVAAIGPAGRLVLVGLSPHDLTIPVSRVLFDGISVVGARAGLFPEAVAVAAERRTALGRLVSHRFPLEDAAAAFQLAHDHPGQAIKVLVTCEPSLDDERR